MIDRLIHDKIYEFFVYVLPCSLSLDIKLPRKRKLGLYEEPLNSFLSSATPNSPIVLTTHSPDDATRLTNLSASNSMLRSLLGVRSGVPTGRSSVQLTGGTPVAGMTPAKVPRIGRPPKLGRPRSKSVTYSEAKSKNKSVTRTRSKSGDVSLDVSPPPPHSPNVSTGNNSTNASPDTLLSLTKRHLCPITPITPPRSSLPASLTGSDKGS